MSSWTRPETVSSRSSAPRRRRSGARARSRSAFRSLGIVIRAGVHFGETEPISGKLGGIAVVTCARVMSVAGPSEVLVTATAREIAAGSGFEFEDRGSHRLKGIDQEQHLFAVTSVDGEQVTPPLEPPVAHERLGAIEASSRLRRRRPFVAIGLALVLVAVAVSRFPPPSAEPPKPEDVGPPRRRRLADRSGRRVSCDGPGSRPRDLRDQAADRASERPASGSSTRAASNISIR